MLEVVLSTIRSTSVLGSVGPTEALDSKDIDAWNRLEVQRRRVIPTDNLRYDKLAFEVFGINPYFLIVKFLKSQVHFGAIVQYTLF